MPRVTLLCLTLLFAGSIAVADNHPDFYTDKGACPFECCTYRDWIVEKATRLHAAPKAGSPLIGTVEKNITIKASTGEVHTIPGKFVVSVDRSPYKKGDVLWVYTYLGEGVYKVWHRGKFIEEEVYVDPDYPNPDDLGYYESKPNSVWWIKVITPDHREGWTNEPENFSNKDACG